MNSMIFLKYIDEETEVLVHADAYLYGEGETSEASYSDIQQFSSRLKSGSSFLTDYCDNIEEVNLALLGRRKNYLEWRWNEMNKFEAERRFAQRMKDNYPPGTRIMLLQMGDDPRPFEPNTRGTVAVVDDMERCTVILIRQTAWHRPRRGQFPQAYRSGTCRRKGQSEKTIDRNVRG